MKFRLWEMKNVIVKISFPKNVNISFGVFNRATYNLEGNTFWKEVKIPLLLKFKPYFLSTTNCYCSRIQQTKMSPLKSYSPNRFSHSICQQNPNKYEIPNSRTQEALEKETNTSTLNTLFLDDRTDENDNSKTLETHLRQ